MIGRGQGWGGKCEEGRPGQIAAREAREKGVGFYYRDSSDIQADAQAHDGQVERQTCKHTGAQAHGHLDMQILRQADTQTIDMHTSRHMNTHIQRHSDM